jgi:SAM-dependent methyltransferase
MDQHSDDSEALLCRAALSDPWSPDQYERFKRERSQPFHDLLALVRPRPKMRAVDLGCGTGELTRHFHEHLGASETIGVDKSENMLALATRHGTKGLRFLKGDTGALLVAADLDAPTTLDAALAGVDRVFFVSAVDRRFPRRHPPSPPPRPGCSGRIHPGRAVGS